MGLVRSSYYKTRQVIGGELIAQCLGLAGLSVLCLAAMPAAADVQTLSWAPTEAAAGTELPDVPAPPQGVNYVQVLDGVTTLLEGMERPDQDIITLGISLGSDPDAAFAYARDRIRTEPYHGTLRAPDGVLAGRGGNAQDKSEFLMTLLEAMGFEARIARGTLPEHRKATFAGAACGWSEPYSPWPARLSGLTDPVIERLHARATVDFAHLTAALAEQTPTNLPGVKADPQHYWVQVRTPEGWRDYDPSFADAQPGQAFTEPEALSRGGDNPHQIRLALTVEMLQRGKLRERGILNQNFSVRDVIGLPIHIGFGPEAPGLGGVLADSLSGTLGMEASMRAAMIVDGKASRSGPFPAPGPVEALDLFADAPKDPVTAIFLDISTSSPDGQSRQVRRTILDLVPPAQRASGADVSAQDLVSPAQGERYPAALESVRDIVVSHGGLDPDVSAERMARLVLALPRLIDEIERPDPLTLMWANWAKAVTLALTSEALTRAVPATDGSTCAFIGSPRVYVSSMGVAPGGQIVTSLDWALDGVHVTGPGGVPDPEAGWRAQLWHGVLQSALETAAMEALTPDPEATGLSTSVLLDGPLAMMEENAVQGLAARSYAAARDARAGQLLVGSAQPEAQEVPAWWRVDPVTGAADARLAEAGNAHRVYTGLASHSRMGIYYLDEATLNSYRLNPRGDIDAQVRRIERHLAKQRAAAARSARPASSARGGGNEYSLLLTLVAIPSSFAAGYTVGTAIYQSVFFALYGYRP